MGIRELVLRVSCYQYQRITFMGVPFVLSRSYSMGVPFLLLLLAE